MSGQINTLTRRSIPLVLAAVASLCGYTQIDGRYGRVKSGAPRVFTMDGNALVDLKRKIGKSPTTYGSVLDLLKDKARGYMATEPYTIVKKTSLPPSGDPHDYESQGPYWWPDPKSTDGLPYIRRDGERNPEIQKLTDHKLLSDMIDAVKTLSLAYFLTDDEKYAEKAAAFMRTWFIDDGTRMNPNLNYGQRIPGITEGRNIGIIETRSLGDVVDAVGLIQGSHAWRSAEQNGMLKWMNAYLDWLLNSENGKGEAKQHNNHGTWYDVQVTSLALYTGREGIAKEALIRVRDERLPKHIEPDGRQPFELARTRSWSYSVMNLQSFFTLAALGEKTGIDLWHYSTSDGRSIIKALDYLCGFTDPLHPWPYQQITDSNPAELVPLLRQAACRFPTAPYAGLAQKLENGTAGLNSLLYPCR